MSKQANRKVIGGFVLLAVGILAASVVIFGSGDLFKESFDYVLFFEESVKGLDVGSPVLYRGFPVGKVKKVVILADLKKINDYVLVYVELYPDVVAVLTEDNAEVDWRDRMSDQIALGLRAQLVPQSLITGKLAIQLSEHPDQPAAMKNIDPEYEEIPTIPSTLSKIEGFMAKLNLEELNKRLISILTSADRILNNPDIDASIHEFKGALTDARHLVQKVDGKVDPLAENLNNTLIDARKLVNHVDGKLDPLSQAVLEALESADSAFKSVDDLVGKRSPTRAELDNTLIEIGKAARSLRVLADYLEQHPEALIKGKGSQNY
ncbi:MAG: MlaD family protein [Desulfobacterales bacterium]|nr:MlaD family protein [Desulfobacterales bacterium]